MSSKEKNVRKIWEPNSKPQALFLSCPFDEMLFGGARGPGKTDSLLMSYLQNVNRGYGPDWKGIIFRQTYKQLEEIVAKSKRFFRAIVPGARFKGGAMEWIFPKGESLKLRHAKRPADMENYQGHEYPFVGFDELCNLASQEVYEKAKGCCRSSNPYVPKIIRATANPLGPGHLWVKRYFIDPAPPLHTITSAEGLKRVFIPATIYDNKNLLEADPRYVASLESISDDNLRRAWLEGDWNVVAGSFFGDVWTNKNIIKPFKIPASWFCFRAFDWGSSRPFAVGWWAIADGNEAPDGKFYPRGALINFAEWYGCKRDRNGQTIPNEGLKLPSRDVARGIKSREQAMRASMGIVIHPGPADPAIWATQDGPSVADNMAQEGVTWVKADNARIMGWQQLRERIWGDDEDNGEIDDRKPMLYVFSTCTDMIRTLPAAPHDERIVDDVDTEFEDHCLHGDTLVWTDKGKIPIRNLVGKSGFTLGSDGAWHRFYNVRMTRKNAELVKLTFADNSELICTPDHKILTIKGFIEAERLLDVDSYAIMLKRGEAWSQLLSVIQSRNLMVKDFIFAVAIILFIKVKNCISQFGNTTMGKFLKAIISTIRTKIKRIIPQIILRYCQQASICHCIIETKKKSFHYDAERLLQNGIVAMQERHGISYSLKKIRLLCSARLKRYVSNVEKNLRGIVIQYFVPITVNQNGGDLLGWTTNYEYVQFVGKTLQSIDIPSKKHVPEDVPQYHQVMQDVKKIEPAGHADVYCMEVEGVHCFAVNGGIIVHNCLDAARYACMFKRRESKTFTIQQSRSEYYL